MTQRFTLRDSGPPISAADIAAFENEIGGRLPDDYKQFLLRTNGGWAEPRLGLNWNGRVSAVPYFDPLLSSPEGGLRLALRNLRELNVNGYLPVTSSQNGEDICLAFLEKVGTVWLSSYSFSNDVPVAATVLRLANSFTELCNDKLVLYPELFCPIEELGKHGTEADLDKHLASGHSLDAIGNNDLSIICEAIKFGNMPMLEACIKRGASLFKALHIAVGNRRPDIVQRLVGAGADVNEKDEYGDRPLFHVAGIGLPGDDGARNRAMQDLLLRLGADPSDAQVL